ncbi:MAG TPA: biopolymer transporter ExbD [Candidatus Angelobacter sp.]|nr:biopolymer transporter ExbD [Candidatus Angelobacter sp.]
MSMTTGARSGNTCEINVTPLIDVLLVLLIIFMVVMPQHYRGEQADIPQPNTKQVKNPEAPIVIQLKDAGEGRQPDLKVNQEQVSWDELEARLKSVYEARADRVAFLKGDPGIEFEYVAQALDISHRAGIERVGLLGKNN